MKKNKTFIKEDVKRLKLEFNIPEDINLTQKHQERLYFKSVTKHLLGYDLHAIMDSEDNDLKIWKILIKKDLLPHSGKIFLSTPLCDIKENSMTFEFKGTINDVLHQLYLISNSEEENNEDETISIHDKTELKEPIILYGKKRAYYF